MRGQYAHAGRSCHGRQATKLFKSGMVVDDGLANSGMAEGVV